MGFSVLMATYSGEKPQHLSACLESLGAQTQVPDEIVLVKDGDLTADLERVIKYFSDLLPLRTLTYRGHGNLGGALALGVINCNNEIIARMDSDDIALPQRFEIQLRAFKKEPCQILGGGISEFDNNPNCLLRSRILPSSPSAFQIGMRNPLNHMTVMYRKSDVIKAGNYRPLSGFEDWYLWLRMHAQGVRIHNMSTILVLARTDASFVSRRSGSDYRDREKEALYLLNEEGLISAHVYILNKVIRGCIRLLPTKLLMGFYRRFLRR